jgi:hypothetical protein
MSLTQKERPIRKMIGVKVFYELLVNGGGPDFTGALAF